MRKTVTVAQVATMSEGALPVGVQEALGELSETLRLRLRLWEPPGGDEYR